MTAEPPVFVAHDVGDLLSAVPTFFGFVPTESVIAVATHGPRVRLGFRMRLDLPPPSDVEDAADLIEGHIRRQCPDGVVLFVISRRESLSALILDALLCRFADIDIVACARADGEHYWVPGEAVAESYDSRLSHPAVVGAIAAGQEILASRDELERRFAPVDDSAVAEALEAQLGAMLEFLAQRPNREEVEQAALAHTLSVVQRASHDDRQLPPHDIAALALWSSIMVGCTALAAQIRRDNAATMVQVWSDVARRAPLAMGISALGLAALAAWTSGDGVQASIAAERANALDPDNGLAVTVLELLRHGVDPRGPMSWM
jgi:hypothetical protein